MWIAPTSSSHPMLLFRAVFGRSRLPWLDEAACVPIFTVVYRQQPCLPPSSLFSPLGFHVNPLKIQEKPFYLLILHIWYFFFLLWFFLFWIIYKIFIYFSFHLNFFHFSNLFLIFFIAIFLIEIIFYIDFSYNFTLIWFFAKFFALASFAIDIFKMIHNKLLN